MGRCLVLNETQQQQNYENEKETNEKCVPWFIYWTRKCIVWERAREIEKDSFNNNAKITYKLLSTLSSTMGIEESSKVEYEEYENSCWFIKVKKNEIIKCNHTLIGLNQY